MDKASFSQQARALERSLYRVAYSYTGSAADAADAVQEALLRAWEKRDSLRDEAFFSTWLTRILINECKTLLRRRRRLIPMGETPDDVAHDPDQADRLALHDALMRLSASERAALALTALDGYTLRQAAAMLRLPEGTLKSKIARARKKLKAALQK